MPRGPGAYVDRRTGAVVDDVVYAPGFMRWAYDTRPGWMLTRLLFSRPWVSHLYGWAQRQVWSKRKIPAFIERMHIDVSECTGRLDDFRSFNDFIVRRIDLSRRPIDGDPRTCISPVDGRVLAFPAVGLGEVLEIKHTAFTLGSLLRDGSLGARYAGGAVVVCRLHLADYHHFHFPTDGVPRASRALPGRLYATTPYSRRQRVPFLVENARALTVFDSDHFGQMLLLEVGAFTVGSIRQVYEPGRHVDRGAHKGYFELGGSVVVLLFQPGIIRLDEDLCRNTREGTETYVRLGERLGRITEMRTPNY